VPRLSGLCLSERVLQPMRFGEIERSTTNPIPSLLRSLPEDFTCQTPKYESDVFLSQPALAPLQTGIFPGSSQNRGSIEQANRVGMRGEQNPCHKPKPCALSRSQPPVFAPTIPWNSIKARDMFLGKSCPLQKLALWRDAQVVRQMYII